MSSAERLRKVRGTVRTAVSQNITPLTGLPRDCDTEARQVNRRVNVLMTRGAELRQLDKDILDVTEDKAVEQRLADSAHFREKIVHAIAEEHYFLTEHGQTFHLRGAYHPHLDYIRHTSSKYDRSAVCKNTVACDRIYKSNEKNTKRFEGSDSDHASSLSASYKVYNNSSIDVDRNNTVLGVKSCESVEPPPQNLLLVTFGSD
ncbi:hypothetical protein HPB51_008897 [Rhipicephalus microplus]|uniref:Uncharacterized protein n=1 Tax=Rhipicephalus microplus TaxID=6941 RepID=A0A9J6ES38_RHIMP|nr:hypothetical protein HPB51_008897 [Rhipicephalus microplus]